jgi:hypothetical protein
MSQDDEAALRVAAAAERGFPGDRDAQVRNVANAARHLGVGVTLKALAIITQRCQAQAPPGANGAGADARLTPHDG